MWRPRERERRGCGGPPPAAPAALGAQPWPGREESRGVGFSSLPSQCSGPSLGEATQRLLVTVGL